MLWMSHSWVDGEVWLRADNKVDCMQRCVSTRGSPGYTMGEMVVTAYRSTAAERVGVRLEEGGLQHVRG